MRAAKLVQHLTANAEGMSERLIEKIRNSPRCTELSVKVSAEEYRQFALDVYRDLVKWLSLEKDSVIVSRYVELGVRRAQQGVPFSHLFWAVCLTHEYLWEYIQQECLLDEPVEFWGGVMLLRSLNQFFDHALYFALVGYESASKGELAGCPAAFHEGSTYARNS
jgi:hypothetical protein